jgi:hypothetical protein
MPISRQEDNSLKLPDYNDIALATIKTLAIILLDIKLLIF